MDKETALEKVKKLLVLGNNGGATEAEAQAAMAKAHEILAKFNLSIDAVTEKTDNQDEDYETDKFNATYVRALWEATIYQGISKLYFCSMYTSNTYQFNKNELGQITGRSKIKQICIIGKPSNIAIVKYIASYVIRTGELLAQEAAKTSVSKRTFINSFKTGFASRIYFRAIDEMNKAKQQGIKDTVTGTALMVLPVYQQTELDIERYKKEIGLRLVSCSGSRTVSNGEGYRAGQAAGNGVSLSANGIGSNGGKTLQIK